MTRCPRPSPSPTPSQPFGAHVLLCTFKLCSPESQTQRLGRDVSRPVTALGLRADTSTRHLFHGTSELCPQLLTGGLAVLRPIHAEWRDHTVNLNFPLQLLPCLWSQACELLFQNLRLYVASTGSKAAFKVMVKQSCTIPFLEQMPKVLTLEPFGQPGHQSTILQKLKT